MIYIYIIWPYDLRDAEITESGHRNGMFSLTRNVTESVKVWMNSSKVGHYT